VHQVEGISLYLLKLLPQVSGMIGARPAMQLFRDYLLSIYIYYINLRWQNGQTFDVYC
jgi:hypothetical protein